MSNETTSIDVKAGQVWRDQDPRTRGRTVQILAVQSGVVYVKAQPSGEESSIRLENLRPVGTKRGYALVKKEANTCE